MAQRQVGIVRHKVLLRHIRDVMRALVLGEQVVERLVLAGPHFLGDRFIPFVSVRELRVHVEYYPPEGENPVADDLPDLELGDVLGNRAVMIAFVDPVGQHERRLSAPLRTPEPGAQPA